MEPSDVEYIETKRIKKGEISLSPIFSELASWIASTYEVEVLNVIYRKIDRDERPRLTVMLESRVDSDTFHEKPYYGFIEERQKRVADKIILS